MKEIVQIDRYDYNELVELAGLNNEKIKERAKQLYEEKGVLSVEVEIDIHRDYNERVTVLVCANGKGSYGDAIIPYEDKREIIALIQEKAEVLVLKKIGKGLATLNDIVRYRRETESIRYRFIGLTVIGWLVAMIMCII